MVTGVAGVESRKTRCIVVTDEAFGIDHLRFSACGCSTLAVIIEFDRLITYRPPKV